MISGVLDIQCILRSDSEYMIKEMSVIELDNQLSMQHWIFKNSYSAQNTKSLRVNKWLERNYHQLSLEYGDIEYKEINRIINSLKFNNIYVKGEQKKQIIKEFIPHVNVINVEDFGCPRMDQLQNADNTTTPCCIFHMNLNPKYCTFYRVIVLRKWIINLNY